MLTIQQTETFERWFRKVRDPKAKAKMLFRIQKLQKCGDMGDHKFLGEGVSEMRIHLRPGYRMYLAKKLEWMIILLTGGVKSSQPRDIKIAKALWKKLEDDS